MAQRNRHDRPHSRHHVYNRGIAKRVMFPDAVAKRRFLALLLCAVRRGEILLEAFSILDTHYHLLVRTTEVPLYVSLMRVQNAYSRYFNRRFHRDGSVPRGRFGSTPVQSLQHAFTAVRYIDFNPVKAGICTKPSLYPFGSARTYGNRAQGPVWLARSLVDQFLDGRLVATGDRALTYRTLFGAAITRDEDEVVRRRLSGAARDHDELDALVGRPPAHVAAWMRRKARLADGLSPWAPIAGTAALGSALRAQRLDEGELWIRPVRKRLSAWPILAAGLMHDLTGMTGDEVARTLGCAGSTAARRVRLHRDQLVADRAYALVASRVARRALEATYPMGLPR